MLKSVQAKGLENMGKEKDPGKKPKSTRNNDKRRERSKVAARCRRTKESEIFSDLSSCLPLPENVRSSLDKTSIARLAVTQLKLKGMMSDVFSKDLNGIGNCPDLQFDSFINNAMGGFVIVLSSDGDIVYVSESITTHLGLSQCEVMGQSVYNFSHPCDHADMKDLFTVNKNEKENYINRSCFFRMKCTITAKGRSVHLRAASYKAINCTGHLFVGENEKSKWFVGIGETLPDPTNVTFPLDKQAFVTRHSSDMKCEDVAGSIEDFLGYKPEDLVGKAFFEFHHAADGQEIGKDFKQLYAKGQIQTQRYRFLAKHGGWAWVISQATVLKSENCSKPTGIICLHFVTSEIENEHEILSNVQVPRSAEMIEAVKPRIMDLEAESYIPDILTGAGLSSPIPSTTKIFAPRTEDMDSGFLMPCDNTLIVSKEEPEDLTHLAPIAGDECVALNVPLLDDLLKSFDEANLDFTRNGYFIDVDSDELPLFNIEEYTKVAMGSGETSDENSKQLMSSNNSPLFLNSDPHLCSISDQRLLSPFPSQCSPLQSNESNGFLSESSMNFYDHVKENGIGGAISPCNVNNVILGPDTNPNFNTLKEITPDEDMTEFKAPYIPVDSNDDFPLLSTANEVIWPLEFLSAHGTGDYANIMDMASTVTPKNSFRPIEAVVPPDKFERNKLIRKTLSRPMLNDANIDKVSLAIDVASILAARAPGDVPKVVTKYIFGNFEPPTKLRKLGSPPLLRNAVATSAFASNGFFPSTTSPSEIHQLGIEFKNFNQNQHNLGFGNFFPDLATDESRVERSISSLTEDHHLNPARKRNLFGILLGHSGGGMPNLCELTRQDCEVNAPLNDYSSLLQGSDLIRALEQDYLNDVPPN